MAFHGWSWQSREDEASVLTTVAASGSAAYSRFPLKIPSVVFSKFVWGSAWEWLINRNEPASIIDYQLCIRANHIPCTLLPSDQMEQPQIAEDMRMVSSARCVSARWCDTARRTDWFGRVGISKETRRYQPARGCQLLWKAAYDRWHDSCHYLSLLLSVTLFCSNTLSP